jgi:hypothetical protein
MQMSIVAGLVARLAPCLALAFAVPSCVVHDTQPVNPGYGYGYSSQAHGSANVTVGEPSPYYVSGMPPEPLYEQMSDSPGDGSVWIDGYWHWNGYEWVWVNGRWEREQAGYVYVEPNYDYVGEQYVYTPGYWSQPERVPRGWNIRDHRDGRPTRVAPPAGSVGFRPVAGGTGGTIPPGALVRDHRLPRPSAPPAGSPAAPPVGTWRPRPPVYEPGGGRTQYYPPPTTGSGAIYQPAPAQPGPGQPPPGQPPASGPIYRPAPGPGSGTGWRPAPAQPIGGPIYVRPAQPSVPGTPIYVSPTSPSPIYHPPPAGGAGGGTAPVYHPPTPVGPGVGRPIATPAAPAPVAPSSGPTRVHR